MISVLLNDNLVYPDWLSLRNIQEVTTLKSRSPHITEKQKKNRMHME